MTDATDEMKAEIAAAKEAEQANWAAGGNWAAGIQPTFSSWQAQPARLEDRLYPNAKK